MHEMCVGIHGGVYVSVSPIQKGRGGKTKNKTKQKQRIETMILERSGMVMSVSFIMLI